MLLFRQIRVMVRINCMVLREAGSKTDLYAIFLKKPILGDTSDDWEALLEFSEDFDKDS